MKMMFIGTDGSMGLRKGYIYNVKVIKGPFFERYPIWVEIANSLITTQTKCPYDSFEAFFRNWYILPEELDKLYPKNDIHGSHLAMFIPEELRTQPKEECDCIACSSYNI